jgi:hypothetical protein
MLAFLYEIEVPGIDKAVSMLYCFPWGKVISVVGGLRARDIS